MCGVKMSKRKFTSYRLAQGSGRPWVARLHSAYCPPWFPHGRVEEVGGLGYGSGGLSETTQLRTCVWWGGRQQNDDLACHLQLREDCVTPNSGLQCRNICTVASNSGQRETQLGRETKPEETDQATMAPGGGSGRFCLPLSFSSNSQIFSKGHELHL